MFYEQLTACSSLPSGKKVGCRILVSITEQLQPGESRIGHEKQQKQWQGAKMVWQQRSPSGACTVFRILCSFKLSRPHVKTLYLTSDLSNRQHKERKIYLSTEKSSYNEKGHTSIRLMIIFLHILSIIINSWSLIGHYLNSLHLCLGTSINIMGIMGK